MRVLCVVALLLWAAPADAQWLDRKTPGVPRTPDGKVNLAAPAPRTADGKPDFTGIWSSAGGQGELGGLSTLRVDPADMKPWARDLQRERGHDYFKGRPDFMCRPSGVEAESLEREKRILQTPAMIAVLNANQTYRQIFLDGRTLEKDPQRRLGYIGDARLDLDDAAQSPPDDGEPGHTAGTRRSWAMACCSSPVGRRAKAIHRCPPLRRWQRRWTRTKTAPSRRMRPKARGSRRSSARKTSMATASSRRKMLTP